MRATRTWLVRCDCGCESTFNAAGDLDQNGILRHKPPSWMYLEWGRNEWKSIHFFAGMSCLNNWINSSLGLTAYKVH